ncbi:DoxX family protein [Haladaptatus halobius]|uniref:DoxX family protein n=1 Tax=Haladaptatus halobius TaxID=2884875 RepID=UPI001D0A022A|nr:DoxX family protein [Haladaptatus halobius]
MLALVFLFAGGLKLITPIGIILPQTPVLLPGLFVQFIAVAEVLGAIGLILPGVLHIREWLTPLAAAGLVIIMTGATVNLALLESKRGKKNKAADSGPKSPVSEKEIEKLRAETQHGKHRHDQRDRGHDHVHHDDGGDELTIGTEYDGVGAEGTRGGVPSDSQIAAGHGKVVHALNQQAAIFNKHSGNQQLKVQLEDVVLPVIDAPEGGFAYGYPFVFDPRARYDRNAKRFVIAAVQYEPGITESGEIVDREEMEERVEEGDEGDLEPLQRPPQGWWCLAVSDDSNPNGKWHVYRIPPLNNEGLVDYPTLGLDRDAAYLSQNFFSEQFEVTMVTLDKATLYAGEDVTTYHFTAMDNPAVVKDDFTVQPALQPFSGGSGGTFYLLNSVFPSPTADALTLWEVTDPLDDPTLECFTVDVEEFGYPPVARQPDSDARIDTLGTRLMNLDYNDGTLWAAHSIQYDWNGDGTAVAAIKWYEIDADARKVV